jgi:hypothetical protein
MTFINKSYNFKLFFIIELNINNSKQFLESWYILIFVTLHEYLMFCAFNILSPNMSHLMKLKSKTWLSKFLLLAFDKMHG